MKNLSLNNGSQNQHSLQRVATDDNLELSIPQLVSNDILEEFEASPINRKYIGARDLRVVYQNQVIGELSQRFRTKSSFRLESNIALISKIQPKCVDKALQDQSWVEAMQEELNQFENSKVWTLVPLPKGQSIIGKWWVFRNKLDESGKVVRNKARLVAQDYNQQEEIDYDETFASVARLETIRMLTSFVAYKGFVLYQMNVKYAFLNDFISKEVYVK